MREQPVVSLAPGALRSDLLLAEHFGVKVATTPLPDTWQLIRSGGTLQLRAPDTDGDYALGLMSSEPSMARRLRTARRTDPLPRAVGLHRRRVERIVDATAGLGRDAMVLASLGCAVTAIERIPALCMLLHLAAEETELPIEVVRADATSWLERQPDAPDVVYLDPMFTEQGRAQVKKEMQACRALAGPAEEPSRLLAAARAAARDRVVVKRHPHHAPLADDASFEVGGDRVRFDVYLRG